MESRKQSGLRLARHFMLLSAAISVGLFAREAFADAYSARFTSSTSVSDSTAVVNISSGLVHPPLEVKNWDEDGVAPFKNRDLSVGDGSDGDFDIDTYLNFNDAAYQNDQVIRINTDLRKNLNFKSFNLRSGWTILPFGSQPLSIRSLSTVTIAGSIDCSGDAGSALNSDNTQISRAGSGRCGGGDGGNGGSISIAAKAGALSGANTSGPGQPGSGAGDGGGGGGAFSQNATSAANGVALGGGAGGAKGSNLHDDGFTSVGGGAGGGGGSAYNAFGDNANHASGGSGGAGGGTISIIAVGDILIPVGGSVKANGGRGGGVAGTGKGGAGGGGGGGSILIMTVGSITLNGSVTATAGSGGTSTGGAGGAGGTGRTWLIDNDGVPGGTTTESPTTLLALPGTVVYKTGSYTVTSNVIDTLNTKPEFLSATTTSTVGSGNAVTLSVAADDSSFAVSGATWVSATSLSQLKGHRYFRYLLTLTSSSATAPPTVSALEISYIKTNRDQFDFQAGCGRVASGDFRHSRGDSSGLIGILILFLMPLLVAVKLRSPASSDTK